jgi:hypothetical protein
MPHLMAVALISISIILVPVAEEDATCSGKKF